LQRRNAIKTKSMKWPNRTIVYQLDSSLCKKYIVLKTVCFDITFSDEYEANIEKAIKEIEEKSCVRFQKRVTEHNFVRIFNGPACAADIGYEARPEQMVSLKIPNCMCHSLILHELMHTLGFVHMHSRSDRDDYIKIHWENINVSDRGRFIRFRPHQSENLTPFDFDSVMLYGNTSYSKDKKSFTMTSLDGSKIIEVCEKPGLSHNDVLAINKLYDC
ncbi:Astacin-like metalloprotease toxin, partial [Leptotrombidium deliense]